MAMSAPAGLAAASFSSLEAAAIACEAQGLGHVDRRQADAAGPQHEHRLALLGEDAAGEGEGHRGVWLDEGGRHRRRRLGQRDEAGGGQDTWSANPPIPQKASTRSPGAYPVTSSPMTETRPATSRRGRTGWVA